MQYLLMRFEHRLSFFVCVIDQALDFLIYDRSILLTVRAGMCQIPSDKHLPVVIVIIDQSKAFRHTVARHHRARQGGRLLDILRSTGRHIMENQLFRNAATQIHDELLHHPSLCLKHLILLRQRHCIACRTTSGRDDRDRVYRSDIRKQMEEDRMARLMIGCDLLLLLGNHTALLLGTNTYLDKCAVNIRLLHINTLFLCCKNRRLVHQILQICAGKSCCRACNLFQILHKVMNKK